jgi:hypothetical protein
MTVPGPSGRVYAIDNAAGAAQTVTALIVGEPSGVGELEEALSEFTGPASVAPVFLPAGFTDGKEMTFVFQADVGGAIDTTDIFHVNRGGSRTITVTYAAGWTFASESYISKVVPKNPPRELATLEVTFRLTGVATVT